MELNINEINEISSEELYKSFYEHKQYNWWTDMDYYNLY